MRGTCRVEAAFGLLIAGLLLNSGCSRPTTAPPTTESATRNSDWGDVPPQPGEDRWQFTKDLQSPMWSRHPWGTTRPGPKDANLSAGVTLKAGFADPQKAPGYRLCGPA